MMEWVHEPVYDWLISSALLTRFRIHFKNLSFDDGNNPPSFCFSSFFDPPTVLFSESTWCQDIFLFSFYSPLLSKSFVRSLSLFGMFDVTSPATVRLFVILLFFHRLSTVQGKTFPSRNITIVDSDSRISYSPSWNKCKTLNTQQPKFGKKCHWSDRDGAYAEFTFIGVAVYLVSPLWESPVGLQITLDSEPRHAVDLGNFHVNEWEISERREDIVWGVSGLENGTHTLRIAKGEHAQYVVLEALIYTTATITLGPELRNHPPRSSEASSPPDQTSTLHAITSFTALYRRDDQQSKQPVIIGAVVGLCIALLGVGLAIVFIRYRKPILAKYGHLIGIPTVVGDETLPTNPATHSLQTAPTSFPTPVYTSRSAAITENRDIRTTAPPHYRPARESKALPPPPSPPSQTSTEKLARTITSFSSKRVVPPSLRVQVKKENPKSYPLQSTSSSFFPNPIPEFETYPNTKRARTFSETSLLDGGNEKPAEGTKSPHPPTTGSSPPTSTRRPTEEEGTPGKGALPHLWPTRQSSLSTNSTSAHTETPLSSSPEILGKHVFPPRNSSKSVLTVGIPLFSIAETPNQAGPSVSDSPSSAKSISKRKSEGRTRVEKEKQRRRHHRVHTSPTGPRDRFSDISSRPSSRITSYAASSVRPSIIVDTNPSSPPVRRLPRPLPPRPNPPPAGLPGSRPETPLPPYVIGSEILPLYFEKTERAAGSLRPPAVSATSDRHFLPSPPPSASTSSCGDVTPTPVPQASLPLSLPPRPLPTVVKKVAVRLPARKLPAPNRPRALTDSATSTPRLLVATHVKQNRSVDLSPLADEQVYNSNSNLAREENKLKQVKPKKSAESSASAISSVSGSQIRRPSLYSSKSAPFTTMQMKSPMSAGQERKPPTSVPVTPRFNSWSDSGTFRYTRSTQAEDETERSEPRTSGDDRVSLTRDQLSQAPQGSSNSIVPLNLALPDRKRRLGPVPPPLAGVIPSITETVLERLEEEQGLPSTPAGPRTPATSRVNLSLPPPPPTPPPPTPPAPRRRAKVWDDSGRRRGERITPPIRESSLVTNRWNTDGSAYSA
ncbi:hypothetical protein L218DRAFT_438280 [Marasmius fiardii PR-910]|nr:hypothetical protein L218DRAFT_438280 [Marasmius fiardii PR-910]